MNNFENLLEGIFGFGKKEHEPIIYPEFDDNLPIYNGWLIQDVRDHIALKWSAKADKPTWTIFLIKKGRIAYDVGDWPTSKQAVNYLQKERGIPLKKITISKEITSM